MNYRISLSRKRLLFPVLCAGSFLVSYPFLSLGQDDGISSASI